MSRCQKPICGGGGFQSEVISVWFPIVAPAKFIHPHLYNRHPILGAAHRVHLRHQHVPKMDAHKRFRKAQHVPVSNSDFSVELRVHALHALIALQALQDCPGPLQDIRIQEMQQSLRLAGQRHSRNYKSNIQHLQHLHEFAAVNIPLGVNVGLRNFPVGL